MGMRVAGTILPTNTFGDFNLPLGFETVRKSNLLAYQIDELRFLKKDPIIIIGPDGDDYLSATPALIDRKMVFAREVPTTLADQVMVGLQGAGTCAFFLPLNVPVPPAQVWHQLETALAQMEYNKGPHILRPQFNGQNGWPILITPLGKDWLEELPEDVQELHAFFELPGLIVHPVPVTSETVLQELGSTHEFQEWKSLYTA